MCRHFVTSRHALLIRALSKLEALQGAMEFAGTSCWFPQANNMITLPLATHDEAFAFSLCGVQQMIQCCIQAGCTASLLQVATRTQVAFLIDADSMLHEIGSDRITLLTLFACALMPLSPYSFCLQARDKLTCEGTGTGNDWQTLLLAWSTSQADVV